MQKHHFNQSRRDFLLKTMLASISFTGFASTLSAILNVDALDVAEMFDDEFHYFDNNCTNLHFYFINAKITRSRLRRIDAKKTAYMVVKLPQQHISEELISEKKAEAWPNGKNTVSRISGFSFLVFSLFPPKLNSSLTAKEQASPEFIDLRKPEQFLDWKNERYFKLETPLEENYRKFKQQDWCKFIETNELQLEDLEPNPPKGYVFKKFMEACRKIFVVDNSPVPFTLLEIPEGLLMTPHGKSDKKKYVIDTYRPPKKRFLYEVNSKRITRTVEEIWSAQMFFDTANGLANPSLRAAAYIRRSGDPEKTPCKPVSIDECPQVEKQFLPEFIDKKELVFLTNLGRKRSNGETANRGDEWNINSRGLTFTGLGAIAKFHYKNFTPPNGTSLAEYEHHITLGRDEYIKVARIGVISVTGQKALHVKIGQRKIRNGLSYMEFKEYIEIIQKDIIYYDDNLLIKKNNAPTEDNYIHVRVDRNSGKPTHSNDDPNNPDDLWNDTELTNYIPGKWPTHYRRWPFIKATALQLISKPIDTKIDPSSTIPCGECNGNSRVFWPVLEVKENGVHHDCTLDFEGTDWNNKPVRFTCTFLFIRKDVIDTIVEDPKNSCLSKIYKEFAAAPARRRYVPFINAEIAYTKDYVPVEKNLGQEELPNKVNVSKTDTIEYYFSICAEPVYITTNKDAEVFNERFFPLYPQVKKAQLYIDNIQGYGSEPLPSIIEYNEDFIQYGFEGTVVRKRANKDKVLVDTPVIYNKARLIFNHTKKFIDNDEEIYIPNVLEKATENRVKDGYKKIKGVFSGAGSSIGGLVNPDFDIPVVGLVKQSISVGREINKKLDEAGKFMDKIEDFNPSDLFRQMPEILNGITLLDILKEIFPEFEAPVNEIKNVTAQIARLRDEIVNNPIFSGIRTQIENVKREIDGYIKGIERLEAEITTKIEFIKGLKNQLDFKYQFAELQRLAESKIDQYKSIFLEYRDGVIDLVNNTIDTVVEYIANELFTKVEKIYPYWILLKESKEKLIQLANISQNGVTLTPAGKKLIQDLIKEKLGDTTYILINLAATIESDRLQTFAQVKAAVNTYIKSYYDVYNTYRTAVKNETRAYEAYIRTKTDALMQQYLAAKKAAIAERKKYERQIENYIKQQLSIDDWLDEIKKNGQDAIIVQQYEADFRKVLSTIKTAEEFLQSAHIHYYINQYDKARKEYESIKTKLSTTIFKDLGGVDVIAGIITFLESTDLKKKVEEEREKLRKHYLTEYDKYRQKYYLLVTKGESVLRSYYDTIGPQVLERIMLVQGFPTNIQLLRKQVEDEFKKLEKELKPKLKDELRNYENLIKKQIQQEGQGLINLVKQEIDRLEAELLDDPDNRQMLNNIAEAWRLFNLLRGSTQKEINYNWSTSSLKNADFGIVSFVTSENPKTTLTVAIKNTVYFQLNRFPPTISRIDSFMENRLSNFSLSLMKSLLINFNEVSFAAGTNRSSKFDVKIRGVQFSGALSFVNAFESWLKSLMGDAFRLSLQPTCVNIGYTLPIPDIKTPSFNFFNLTLNFDFFLHFDKKPLQLGFSLARPDSKFGITVGIYAGFGYFSLIGEPKRGITEMEIALEFGGYFGLSLGPMRGEVKLVVGLYYRKDVSGVIIEGYFLCEGRVKLWIVMITARFYMGVRSQSGYVEGRCTVTNEIKLGKFFKKSITTTYYKKIAGSSPGNRTQSASTQKSLENFKRINRIDDQSSKEVDILDKVTNKIKREAIPIDLKQWEQFINSYID